MGAFSLIVVINLLNRFPAKICKDSTMFAIGYVNRPTLPTSNSRSPITKRILSISWKIDHFQSRSGVVQSVLFSTNSLSSGSSSDTDGGSDIQNGSSGNESSNNQPSEIWCLELDTNRSPFEERGFASMQQERDQQVPVGNNMNRYANMPQESTRRYHENNAANYNRNDPGSRSGSRLQQPEFEIPCSSGHSQFSNGSMSNNSSSALLQQAADSTSSNYMSLYLRLIYWKQEFSKVHLKAGVFTDRMDVTVLGEKDFQTDEPIGWAQFLNKESVSKFILGNQDKQDQERGQGYIHLYLELVLDESKRKEGVECRALAHSDLIMDFSALLHQRSLSDVTLVCGDKKMDAHKAVLAARSPIFRAMFMHPSQENQTNQIELKDVDYEILEELVYFIYTGQVARLDFLADSLLPVADKYAIVSLVKLCEESLSFNLTVENVVHRLVLSYLHNAVTLKRAALGFIERNICTVRKTEGWVQAQLKYPRLFLECFPMTEQLSLIVSKSMMSF